MCSKRDKSEATKLMMQINIEDKRGSGRLKMSSWILSRMNKDFCNMNRWIRK